MFFSLFPAAKHVGALLCVSMTKLYKFVWNIISNNSSTENRADLRLGQSPYLFIIYFLTLFIEWFLIFILMA